MTDAFVAPAGGIGTLRQLFEGGRGLRWLHATFCLSTYAWDGLTVMDMSATRFLSQARRGQLLKAETPGQAIDLLDAAAKSAAQGMVW